MRGHLWALCFGVCLLIGTACEAATIEPVKGDVSLNQGRGFQKVDGITEAKEGDAVMVSPDGSASVSYPDGCKVSLQPGAVMTIAALSPCASGSYAEDQNSNPYAPVVIGSLLAGVTGFVIYEITQSGKNNTPVTTPPASP